MRYKLLRYPGAEPFARLPHLTTPFVSYHITAPWSASRVESSPRWSWLRIQAPEVPPRTVVTRGHVTHPAGSRRFLRLGQILPGTDHLPFFPGTRATAGPAPNPAPEKRGWREGREGLGRGGGALEGEGRLSSPISPSSRATSLISLRKAAGTRRPQTAPLQGASALGSSVFWTCDVS